MNRRKSLFLFCVCLLFQAALLQAEPVSPVDVDDGGAAVSIEKRLPRLVSLVPAVTEILYAIGAGEMVQGHTYHGTFPDEDGGKIVGGFSFPLLERIERLEPDIIFTADLHEAVRRHFAGKARLVELSVRSIKDVWQNSILLGRLSGREEAAARLVRENQEMLTLVGRKVAGIPPARRKRVLRFMGAGQGRLMVPGDDSFQNDFIRAAGGMAPQFGKTGNMVKISKEEWLRFNPQAVYGCGGREKIMAVLEKPGWRDVEAVRNKQVFSFPCDLTCRAGARIGPFVSWLSARIYQDEYSRKAGQIYEDQVVSARELDIGLGDIKQAQIISSRIHDFINKTLVIDFREPQAVLSTLEGMRQGVTSVGNHYFPPPGWGLGREQGLAALRRQTYAVMGKDPATSSFLFTGADMDNLSIQRRQYRDMEAYALVTAGVKSNAVRMARDVGNFYEPGTINILILTNMELTPRAMTRAIISATEAKTAALMDLDIRSSYSPARYQATGTGTDNILVAQGRGVKVDNAGGHTKLGELIAKAVHAGVREAVARQNGITAERSVFERLKERRISLWSLVPAGAHGCSAPKGDFVAALEELLLDPGYAGFVSAAFVVSDAAEAGLIADLDAHGLWCAQIAAKVANKKDLVLVDLIPDNGLPKAVWMALNALANGVSQRQGKGGEAGKPAKDEDDV